MASTFKKIDALFDWGQEMYLARRFAEVDAVLARVNIEKLDDALIHAWLVVAWWPENVGEGNLIPSRTVLHKRVAEHWETRNPGLLKELRGPRTCKGFFTA